MNTLLCDACGHDITGVDYDDRHTGHEPDCPGDCQCDIAWHAACCPECHDDGEGDDD